MSDLELNGSIASVSQFKGRAAKHPGSFGDLVLWLRSDSISGVSNGDPVLSWNDLSGNDNHAVQSSPSSAPKYVANAVNGLPALEFDGVDDFLDLGDFLEDAIEEADTYRLDLSLRGFMVVERGSEGTVLARDASAEDHGEVVRQFWFGKDSDSTLGYVYYRTLDGLNGDVYSNVPIRRYSGNYDLIEFYVSQNRNYRFVGANGLLDRYSWTWFGGDWENEMQAGTVHCGLGARISSAGTLPADCFRGRIAEVVLYRNRDGSFPHGEPETEAILGYFRERYSLNIDVGPCYQRSRYESSNDPGWTHDPYDARLKSAFTNAIPGEGYRVGFPPVFLDADLGECHPRKVVSLFEFHVDETRALPFAWNLYGRNQGQDWTLLDERSGDPMGGATGWHTFQIENSTAFRWYRIEVLSAGWYPDPYYDWPRRLEVSQIQLLEAQKAIEASGSLVSTSLFDGLAVAVFDMLSGSILSGSLFRGNISANPAAHAMAAAISSKSVNHGLKTTCLRAPEGTSIHTIGPRRRSLLDTVRSVMIENGAQARAVADARLLPSAYRYDTQTIECPHEDMEDGDAVLVVCKDSGLSGNHLVEEVEITGSLREGVYSRVKTSKIRSEE